MLILPNNCKAGKFTVTPRDWNTSKADMSKPWTITYYFFDDNLGKRLQVRLQGMNRYTVLKERQAAVRQLIADEIQWIQVEGYNRITKTYPSIEGQEISPYTPFIAALTEALAKIKVVPAYRTTIKSVIKYVEIAAKALHLEKMYIKDISRKHIKSILEYCSLNKDKWSAYTHNSYRKNLGILFKELIEQEAMDHNPVTLISKQKELKQQTEALTIDERKKIDKAIKKFDKRFWLLIHIFFHSGARTTELLKVRKQDVDLKSQIVKYQVLKGTSYEWKKRAIKDIALPYWQEALKGCKATDYVFSHHLLPGPKPINAHQISRRWNTHVIKKLGINKGFYSLKATNTTEIVNLLNNKEAAKLNAESVKMINKHYDAEFDEREQDKIKSLKNKFA